MASSDTSPVRIAQDLLDRATALDPENRATVIRAACERGLEILEQESAASRLADVRQVVRDVLRSDPEFQTRIVSEALSLLPSRRLVFPFLPASSVSDACFPLFEIEPGETELRIPQINWLIYQPLGLRIWDDLAKDASVEVADLRPDSGNGPNLLYPGWHGVEAFAGNGGPLVRFDSIRSPMDLRIRVRARKAARIAISLEARVVVDDNIPSPDLKVQTLRAGRLLPSECLIRIPFSGDLAVPSPRLRVEGLNHGLTRIVGITFDGADREALLHVGLADFFLLGGLNLLPHEGWSLAADYAGVPPALRDYPVLCSPNMVEVNLRTSGMKEVSIPRPSLLLATVD